MARLNIDTGTLGNPATGDSLRTAMTKVNTNFEEVYQIVGDPDTGLLTTTLTNGDIKVQPNGTGIVEIDQLQVTDAAITSLITNGDLTLSGNGTGEIAISSDVNMTSGTPTLKLQRTDNANVPKISFVGSAGTEGASIQFDGTSGTANEIILSSFSDSAVNEKLRVQTTGAKVTGILDVDGGITIKDNLITASRSNDNLQLDATGTGAIEMVPAVIMMANLPTSNPNVAGQLFRSGNDLRISTG